MEDEVAFKECRLDAEETTPRTVSPQMVTTEALQNIVDNWKTKFQILSDGIRAAQVAAETCSANIEDLHRDSRKHEEAQERRIQEMQIGLVRFLDRCDPVHLAASARMFESPCAPVMSTPVTQPGAPSRRRPDFNYESPVDRAAPMESTCDSRNRHYDARPTHEDDQGNNGSNNSGMNNSGSRPSSSPKVPIFDGTVSAQFRPSRATNAGHWGKESYAW